MTTAASAEGQPADGDEPGRDPAISHHYVLVLLVEIAIWGGLAWLAATYR